VRGVAADPDDDAVLAAALDGGARYLVTGDHALRDLSSFQDVEIVTARELLESVQLQWRRRAVFGGSALRHLVGRRSATALNFIFIACGPRRPHNSSG
jgi:hypothetical protein